jgi:hypothetical protein
MKSSYLRAGFALLCAVILSACGGSNGNLALSGTITYVPTNVAPAGLVLINKNTSEKLTIETGATSFVFTKLLASDEAFDVEVLTQPSGANCEMSNNKNNANVYTVYYVAVKCTSNPWVLGGTVKGLTGTGLVLANGPDTIAVLPSATAGADVSFIFPTKVSNKSAYGGSVLVQPSGQTCTFSSALNPGTMPDSDQKGLIVNCVNN